MSKLFISSSLAFYNNKIVVEDSGSAHNGMSVMMDWEDPIMSASAAYVTQGGGDILELGFGMGISAGYIQSHSISSHTIVEIHPQMLEKANTWASGKSNVTIIEGDWNNVEFNKTYDGIFIDTYGGDNWDRFKEFALSKGKSGAKVTYWNADWVENEHKFDNISYEDIPIEPEIEHHLWYDNIYHLPKVVI